MTRVSISLPDAVYSALRKAPREIEKELPLAAAIHWYQQTLISMERAAEIANMSRAEFLQELARRRIDGFVVDFDDLAEELALD